MKKFIPIIIVFSTIFAMNQGIEYWRENTQNTLANYQLIAKIDKEIAKKPKKQQQRTEEFDKGQSFTDDIIKQYLSFNSNPTEEIVTATTEDIIDDNYKVNSVALACPVMPVPTIAFTNANVSSTISGCGSVSLTASGCGSNDVRWYQNGYFQTTGSSYSAYPYETSNYFAECWDGNSCTSTQSNMVQIPVWKVRVTPQTIAPTICAGNTVEFTAEIYNASSTTFLLTPTYQWQKNYTNIPLAINASYTANSAGYYNVIVKMPPPFPNGCTVYGYAPQVNYLPTPTITANTPTDVCPGNTVRLGWNYDYQFYQGAGTVAFQWKRNGVNINSPSATTQYLVTTQPGDYTLMITKNTCSVVTPVAITVTNSGTAPTEKPIITNAANSTTQLGTPIYACPSTAATFFASGCSSGQQAYWSNGTIGGSSTFYSGDYPFDQKITVRCGTSENCLGLASDTLILSKPKVEIIKTVGPTICNGTLLTASSTPNTNVAFQWLENNANLVATGNQYSPQNGNNYNIVASFTNLYPNGGCTITSLGTNTTSSPAVTTPIIKACSGVNPSVCTELVSPVTLFSGTSVTLQASNCNATVTWSTGATGTSLVVSSTGTYASKCSNTTCTSPNSNIIQVIVNPCNASVNLSHPPNDITNNPTTNGTLWQASSTNGSITATNWVTGGGTRATYQAKSITLSPGFKADLGTIFTASIGGCN